MGKRVLITGATSYLAVALIRKILSEDTDMDIYAVVRPHSANLGRVPTDSRIHLTELSMSQYDRLASLAPDGIRTWYHFAWEGVRGAAREDAALQEQNRLGAVSCIDSALALRVPVFIGIGSQAEYGNISGKIKESQPPAPDTAYGKKKLQVCEYGRRACEGSFTRFLWVRIFSVYGLGEHPGTLLMSAKEKLKKGLPLKLSPCEHLWNYVYLKDAAEALFLLGNGSVEAGIYNLASKDTRPLKDFVLELRELLSSESRLDFGAIPYRNGVPCGMHPDIGKIEKALNWKPKYSFRQGITELLREREEA